jgi:hypothetical protein
MTPDQDLQKMVFEEYIRSTIERGADTRETALRWIVENTGWSPLEMTSPAYVCYTLNIPYSYENEIRPILAELYKEFYGLNTICQ